MAKEHTTALGECVDVCKAKTEEHVECKVRRSDISLCGGMSHSYRSEHAPYSGIERDVW